MATEKTTTKAAPKAKTATKKAVKSVAASENSAFAVIMTGGKQYRVSEGTSIKVEKIKGEHKVGDKFTFDQVLMTGNGSETVLGTPTVAGVTVSGELTEISRHAKVIIYKYKNKSRSGTSKKGHRQPYFKIKISSIK